jgi:hypothetical protein
MTSSGIEGEGSNFYFSIPSIIATATPPPSPLTIHSGEILKCKTGVIIIDNSEVSSSVSFQFFNLIIIQ